jgi:hypothetical protein
MGQFQLEDWVEDANQYAPGFAIWDALTSEEPKALGLRAQDLGGPASSPWCVSTTVRIEKLNSVLARKQLSFVFVDDAGPEEEQG